MPFVHPPIDSLITDESQYHLSDNCLSRESFVGTNTLSIECTLKIIVKKYVY